MTATLWSIVLALVTMPSTEIEIRVLNSVQSRAQTPQVVQHGQAVEVDLRTVRLAITFPTGRIGYADISMVREPKTRLFWWFYRTVGSPDGPGLLDAPLGDSVVYLDDSKMTGFLLDLSTLWVRESSSHFTSLDDGQAKVFERIKENAERIEKGTMRWWSHSVRLGPALRGFFSPENSAALGRGKIRDVTRASGEWRLTIEGPQKNRAQVVISEDYRIVDATVLPRDGR